PAIVDEMTLGCFNIYSLRKVHLQSPTSYVQFMCSIVSCFSCTVVPSIPVPVVVPCLYGIITTWCRSLEKLPIKSGRSRCFLLQRHFSSFVDIKCHSLIGCTNNTIVDFIDYLNGMGR